MAGCCDPRGCDDVFRDGFASRTARRYRRKGLDTAAHRMVELLAADGLAGATVLDIGGGVGAMGIELLRRGASSALTVELSTAYDEEARRLASEAAVADRVHRKVVDLAATPDQVPAADIVVLHRVVCCYPDHARLLGVAADHCRSRMAFSHPPRNLASRALVAGQNAMFTITGKQFRTFAHPPEKMLGTLEARGLRPIASDRAGIWRVQFLTR